MTIVRLDGHADQAGAWDVLAAAKGHLAFDIGANIGQAARVLAQNFATVVSLEPCDESYMVLLEETPPNVVCLPTAAGPREGTLRLTECEGSIRTGQLTTGEGLAWGRVVGQRSVPATTIDALAEHYGQPQFVKIDTEGHEVAVLEGWRGPKCDVLIEVHKAENEYACRKLYGAPLRKLTHDPKKVGARTRHEHFWLASEGA